MEKEKSKIEPYDDGRVCNIFHLLGLDANEQEWLIDKLLPLKSIIYLAGDSGIGKSLIMLLILILSITNKKVFNEFEVKRKINVLLIDVENRKENLALRIKKIVNGVEVDIPEDTIFNVSYGHNIKLDEDTIKKIENMIVKDDINLIVFDSLIRFLEGNESSSEDAKKIFQQLNPLVNNYNVSLLILHHTVKRGKGEKDDMRGSGEFSASADIVYTLSQKIVSGKELKILKQVKNRNEKAIPDIAFEIVNEKDDLGNEQIKIVRDTTYVDFRVKSQKDIVFDYTIEWLNSLSKKKFTTKNYLSFLNEKYGKKYSKYNEILNQCIDLGYIKRVKNGEYIKV